MLYVVMLDGTAIFFFFLGELSLFTYILEFDEEKQAHVCQVQN